MLGITEVIENLYISGLEARQTILNKGIRSVINISSECPIQDLGKNVDYEKVSLLDLPTSSIQPHFDRLTDRIHQSLKQGKKTLVHCYVGRSRSATIILAYLMRYKQMTLRDAYHHLRARRPIIGPNFGFIRQLIDYERDIFGRTSVSFVNTSYGPVPDIYLAMPTTRPRRQASTTTSSNYSTLGKRMSSPPPQRSNTTITLNPTPARSSFLYSSSPSLTLPRQHNSPINRPAASALPARATTTLSSYGNTVNPGADPSKIHRPMSSTFSYPNPNETSVTNGGTMNKSLLRQTSDAARLNVTPIRTGEFTREYFLPTKVNSFRTVKYIPSSYNRYHRP